MVATHSVFGLEVANDRLDSLAAFEPASVMLLLIRPRWRVGSSAGAGWILAMGNRRFLQGNSPHDRSLLQFIKAKSTTLIKKISGLRIFQGRRSRARIERPEARDRDRSPHALSAYGPVAAPFPTHPSAERQWCSIHRHQPVPTLRPGSRGGFTPATGSQPGFRGRLRQASQGCNPGRD